jgi:CheY-like chemotaxis protein
LAPRQDVKALIVDDVKENRDVVIKLLNAIGVQTFDAKDGKEGMDQARRHHPDIIFMDMRMPVMNGEEALKIIHSEFGKDKIKIVAITASAFDRKPEYYLNLGFDEYISKPFLEEDIFKCLKVLLNVEFIYEDETISSDSSQQTSELDFSQFSMLEGLHGRMSLAAENYNITDLEDHIEELSQSDDSSGKLVKALEKLLKSYDVEKLSKALGQIQKT